MSAQIIKLGLLSLISSALAAPIASPNELTVRSAAAGINDAIPSVEDAHLFRKHGKCTRPHAMEAIATNGQQTAEVVSTQSTFTTMTSATTVWVEPDYTPAATAPAAVSTAVAAEAKQPSSDLNNAFPSSAPTDANNPAAKRPQGGYTATPAAVTTPVATPAPSPVSSYVASPSGTSPASSSGAKGGVAYTQASQVAPFIGASNIGWCYNWNANPGGVASGIEYVPTLWGTASTFTNTWVGDATAALNKGATAVVGFNEPDHSQQANLDAGTAASAYKQYITNNFGGKTKLVAPSVTNGGAPMGLTYLQSFMSACSDCGIQAINLHWYDSSSNFDYFTSYIEGAYKQFNLPIWLTEFGTTDGNDQAFLQKALPWLESQSYVERYAYFMAEDGKLLSGIQLSAAGQTYASG